MTNEELKIREPPKEPPAVFTPARTKLQGVFPYTCGRCKKENSVRAEWQYFCQSCMNDMDIHVY